MTPATTLMQRISRATGFAHLAQIGGPSKPKAKGNAEDDKDDGQRRDRQGDEERAEDDDEGAGKQQDREDGNAEGEDKDKKGKKGKKAKKAEGGDKDENADEGQEGDNGNPKNKKGEGEEEDEYAEGDDDDEEMRGNSPIARARRREQARCAAIFACPAAARNVVLAANLAFKSRMPREEAIAMLRATPAAAADGGQRRRNPDIGPGGEQARSSGEAVASSWEAAMEATGGKRRAA